MKHRMIRRLHGADDHRAEFARKLLQFGQRHRMHGPRRFGRPLAQGDGEYAAGPQQAKQLAQRAGALGRHDVLPHPAEQDQVEGKPEAKR
jgi:hypothetical protein